MKLYCNTMFCIVAGKGCRRQNCIAIQNCIATERLGSWAGTERAGVGAGARRRGRWGAQAWTLGRARQGVVGARPGRWARGRACCGLALGCALDALALFSIRIDSVLFLSRFLDIVREPGS